MSSNLLPLFPLDLVLLPGVPLPLHIFEPRYIEMIGECLDQDRPFGVIRGKEKEIAEIGCTAGILTVTKKNPDGTLDIVTEGRQPFEVIHLNHDRAFLQAEVLYFDDDPVSAAPAEVELARKLFDEIMTLAGAQADSSAEVDARRLSFRLAGSLPLDLDFKQELLGMKSEAERLRALISFFQTILPDMRRTVHVRRKAGGNGHG